MACNKLTNIQVFWDNSIHFYHLQVLYVLEI